MSNDFTGKMICDSMKLHTENAKRLVRLTKALKQIASNGEGFYPETFCHPEGCVSPGIAQKALKREGIKWPNE